MTDNDADEFGIFHVSAKEMLEYANSKLSTVEERVSLTPEQRLTLVECMLRRKSENEIKRVEKRVRKECTSEFRQEEREQKERASRITSNLMRARVKKQLTAGKAARQQKSQETQQVKMEAVRPQLALHTIRESSTVDLPN